MKTTDENIIVSQMFSVSKSELWSVITSHEHMIHWFFEDMPSFKAEIGFKTKFNVKAPSQDFMHLWEITQLIPENEIVYNWRYEGLKGNAFVTFQLESIKKETQLIVTVNTVEDFDTSIPEFKRESCQQGWEYFIQQRLVTYINNI
ncbi:hypothetical protein GCM10022271_24500 [Corallibacter vietnamensis]|uniref:Activator of Hsp90 ATPase homologue 1/2-like C-terminal domain-containing protein n=1 Tax=Corallibacter vietnamensis TaxID=904130 RepID=A0ABP7HKN1_9FLAO